MKSGKSAKDGFQPGFQRSIRKHCATYGEYKRHLKEMGLIEMGYDDLPQNDEPVTNYFPDDVMKNLYQKHGVSLDSREVQHLRGEL